MSDQPDEMRSGAESIPRSDTLKLDSGARQASDWRVKGLLFMVLVLLAAIFYLLAALNAKRYSIEIEKERIVVKKGRFFPTGMRSLAGDPKYGAVYGPLVLPEKPPESLRSFRGGVYDDLVDLNLALSEVLLALAADRLGNRDIQGAQGYVGRAEKLSGLDEKRLNMLRRLKGNISFREGVLLMEGIDERLRLALDKFRTAQALGSDDAKAAEEWIVRLEKKLNMLAPAGLPAQTGAEGEGRFEQKSPQPEQAPIQQPAQP